MNEFIIRVDASGMSATALVKLHKSLGVEQKNKCNIRAMADIKRYLKKNAPYMLLYFKQKGKK